MSLDSYVEERIVGDDNKRVTVVIKPLTKEQAREMYPYRPNDKYSESQFGGDTYHDDICLLLNKLAVRCKMCEAPTRTKSNYLRDGVCPDCNGGAEYIGHDPRKAG